MADEAFAENPWSVEFWNLTRQGEYIKKYGVNVARTKAKQVGARLGDLKPRQFFQQPVTVLVQRRNIISDTPLGVTGNGPPDPNL